MNLLSPWNLLWLAPLAGGIIALWILRLKRQQVQVSSLYLWRSLLNETQANTPFQKLRRNLLLFLQLLAAFLLIFALARPFVMRLGQPTHTLILIIDASASMSATDVNPSRLASAQTAANQFAQSLMHGSDTAAVIVATNHPTATLNFTTERSRVQAAIDAIHPTDTVADLSSAMTLAMSMANGRQGAMIRVFSDGDYDRDSQKKLASLTYGTVDVAFVPVGASDARNLAITAMDGRRDPVSGDNEVFVKVQSFGGAVSTGATLSLLRDGRLIAARDLTLTGGSQSETFDTPLLKPGGIVTARLDDVRDDLNADNSATLVLPPPRKRRVLLVTKGNVFLERGLNLDPDVILEEVTPSDFETLGHRGVGYSMVVFDSALPSVSLPPGNYLVFHASSSQMPASATAEVVPTPAFVDQNHTHPVMRFVDLEGLSLRSAPRTVTTAWGQSLADAESGPLIVVGDHQGRRVIDVMFDLSDSDWPLRVSFPIFLTNAVDWLTASVGLGPANVDTPSGSVATLSLPPGPPSITVARPDGKNDIVSASPDGGLLLFDRTDKVGLYHARVTGAYDYPFAVTLLNKDESSLRVNAQTALNHAGPPQTSAHTIRVRNEFGTTIAAVALVLLMLEWFLFHRRP